jgi:hypothetical protein
MCVRAFSDREQYVNAEELWEAGLERARNARGIMLPLLDAHCLHQALYPSFITLPNTVDQNLFINTYRYPGATARAIRTVECLVNFLNVPSTTRKSAADFWAYAHLVGNENWVGLAEEDEVCVCLAHLCSLVTKPHTVLAYVGGFASCTRIRRFQGLCQSSIYLFR